jgi:hypothetical protein
MHRQQCHVSQSLDRPRVAFELAAACAGVLGSLQVALRTAAILWPMLNVEAGSTLRNGISIWRHAAWPRHRHPILSVAHRFLGESTLTSCDKVLSDDW